MNRVKKTVLNIIAIVALFFIIISFSGLHLTPLAAHRASEHSIHYGPSEIVHIQAFTGGKYILGKYDKWISCNTIHRVGLVFWRFGSQVTGIENDPSKPVNYTFGMSQEKYRLYGIINDSKISKIEVVLKNGEVLEASYYDDMFMLWGNHDDFHSAFDLLKAYDSNNNLLLESTYPGEFIYPVP